jgi:hypothetical protein
MQVENVLRGVASRSRYQSDAQRQAVFAGTGDRPRSLQASATDRQGKALT